MDIAAAGRMYDILAGILLKCNITEIAVSPYTIPLEDAPKDIFSEPIGLSPADIFPLTLYSMNQLVIPQKPLYAMFAHASHLLSTHFPRNVADPLLDKSNVNADKLAWLDIITKVMMIQNSEHARALNIRKKMILARTRVAPEQREPILEAELKWTSVVLGIAAHAKVGLLWHHRRWLLSHLSTLPAQYQQWENIHNFPLRPQRMSTELSLIAACAQKYPRNYMAWAYRTWFVRFAELDLQEQLPTVLVHLERNPTDHTALQHLLQLLQMVQAAKVALRDPKEASVVIDLPEAILELVRRYPDKETPWLALRHLNVLSRDSVLHHRSLRLATQFAGSAVLNAVNENSIAWINERGTKVQNYARRTALFLHCVAKAEVSYLSSDHARTLLSETRLNTWGRDDSQAHKQSAQSQRDHM